MKLAEPSVRSASLELNRGDDRSVPGSLISALCQLIRPKHWIKNGLVLAPLVFSQHLFASGALPRAAEAFLCWCGLASGIYVVNDLFDREADQQHPDKCNRPLARGAVPIEIAIGLAVVLLLGGLWGLLALGIRVLIPGLAYVGISLAYSRYLKHIVIIDVMTLASGYVLRVVGGAAAVSVWVSPWLILCTGVLALFLGLEKRRGEQALRNGDFEKHRPVLNHYSPYFLDQLIGVLTASALISYTLYTISSETLARFGTNKLFLTVPFVMYGIFRYLYLVHQKGQGGNPTEIFFRDLPFALNIVLWVVSCVLIIYFPK